MVGARVLLLANDPSGKWVNGSRGAVLGMDMSKVWSFEKEESEETLCLHLRLDNGSEVFVPPYKWEYHNYRVDTQAKTTVRYVVGSYVNYPVKLAWAMTIHKEQGMSLDRCHVRLGSGWRPSTHGLTYVALSRCRTLAGLTIERPLGMNDLNVDPRVSSMLAPT
jgi:ATP-dependent exoDNAse (exonuclease V) alpha subunit